MVVGIIALFAILFFYIFLPLLLLGVILISLVALGLWIRYLLLRRNRKPCKRDGRIIEHH